MAESCFSWQSATWLAQMRRELQPGTASSCCFGTCWAIPRACCTRLLQLPALRITRLSLLQKLPVSLEDLLIPANFQNAMRATPVAVLVPLEYKAGLFPVVAEQQLRRQASGREPGGFTETWEAETRLQPGFA